MSCRDRFRKLSKLVRFRTSWSHQGNSERFSPPVRASPPCYRHIFGPKGRNFLTLQNQSARRRRRRNFGVFGPFSAPPLVIADLTTRGGGSARRSHDMRERSQLLVSHNWGRDLKIHESVQIFEIGAHLAKCAMRFQKLSPRFSVPVKSAIPGTGGLELVSVSRQEPTSAKSQLGKRPKDP